MVAVMFCREKTKIVLEETLRPKLFPLFRKGVQIEVQSGISLYKLFHEQWKIPVEYIHHRISSVFLDSHPVDDLENTHIAGGMVLALSSAMPGLVGAVMRRGLGLSSLRQSITYRERNSPDLHHDGIITVKLFNLLVEELSEVFFRIGFRVRTEDARKVIPEGIHLPKENYVIIVNSTP